MTLASVDFWRLWHPRRIGFESGSSHVQVYLMMQHAQANYDLKLFMKADDDTFVNVPIMLNALRESVKDRFVYIGYPIKKTVQ